MILFCDTGGGHRASAQVIIILLIVINDMYMSHQLCVNAELCLNESFSVGSKRSVHDGISRMVTG